MWPTLNATGEIRGSVGSHCNDKPSRKIPTQSSWPISLWKVALIPLYQVPMELCSHSRSSNYWVTSHFDLVLDYIHTFRNSPHNKLRKPQNQSKFEAPQVHLDTDGTNFGFCDFLSSKKGARRKGSRDTLLPTGWIVYSSFAKCPEPLWGNPWTVGQLSTDPQARITNLDATTVHASCFIPRIRVSRLIVFHPGLIHSVCEHALTQQLDSTGASEQYAFHYNPTSFSGTSRFAQPYRRKLIRDITYSHGNLGVELF